MLNVRIVAVGGVKEDFYRAAIAEYAKRLSKYCKFEITEVKECNNRNQESNIQAEAELIRAKLKGFVILCDRAGEVISSEMLSDKMCKAQMVDSQITFVIGGSHGVGRYLDDCVNASISFGKITFPHQLFRVILTEQIYRAFTIMNGAAYHK